MSLTHLDANGKACMVDISEKETTSREAIASGKIFMNPRTLAMITDGSMPKGDVFAAARIAGIMAAKRTSELIPLCHQIPLDTVKIEFLPDIEKACIAIEATARCSWKTGVEMEAMTAVSVAGLTIYDMCKAVDKEMEISEISLLKKIGGKSGEYIKRGV
jgi:cyclic pyranopterin monophosphate synthase